MAVPRDRSRHRWNDRQDQYELQEMQASNRGRMDEGSAAHSKDLFGNRHHGHLQNSKSLRLDRRILRACKERLIGTLATCRARLGGALRKCIEGLTRHWMLTLFLSSITCIILVLAFPSLHYLAKPPDYGPENSTGGETGRDHSTTAFTGGSTVYHTISVYYKQFYGARPVHQQEPIAIHSTPEQTGHVQQRDLNHCLGTGPSASLSGSYFKPTSAAVRDSLQAQQMLSPSSRSASNTKISQGVRGSLGSMNLESDAKITISSCESKAALEPLGGQTDAETLAFTRWGVEILDELRRRTRRSLELGKKWCIEHTCSSAKQLKSMCHKDKAKSGPQKRECELCLQKGQRQQQELEEHCTAVAKHAFNATLIHCGILLFVINVTAIILAARMLKRRRRAKAVRILHNHAMTESEPQEKTDSVSSRRFLQCISKFGRSSKAANSRIDDKAIETRPPGNAVGLISWYKSSGKRSVIGPANPDLSGSTIQKQQKSKSLNHEISVAVTDPHERVPILPPAPPAVSSRVFSNIENAVQGSLSGAGTNNSQHDAPEMPRRFSRQSRAVSSGREQSSSEATHRRDTAVNVYNLQCLTERS